MIVECPRCGTGVPMDVDARTRYVRGECPRCRFVATTVTDDDRDDRDDRDDDEPAAPIAPIAKRAVADGGRELELEEIEEIESEVTDR